MNARLLALGLALGHAACPAAAAPLLSGEARLVSDYRFRGISRSDAGPAVQGRLGLETGPVYAEAFASSLGGWGRFAGAEAEVALSAGLRQPLGLATLDLGGTVYTFPGAVEPATVAEARGQLSGGIGPLQLTAGTAWAPPQRGLASATARNGSNIYLWGAARSGLPGTPLSLDARLGHSRGRPGLAGAGALSGRARAWDWRLGADYVAGRLSIGAAVTGTDLGDRADGLLQTARGQRLAGTGVVLSVSAGF